VGYGYKVIIVIVVKFNKFLVGSVIGWGMGYWLGAFVRKGLMIRL